MLLFSALISIPYLVDAKSRRVVNSASSSTEPAIRSMLSASKRKIAELSRTYGYFAIEVVQGLTILDCQVRNRQINKLMHSSNVNAEFGHNLRS